VTEIKRRKSSKDRKAEIIDVAIRLAADCGPDRLTTEMLAREIGISQPAIFRHFASKNDIWLAVAARIVTFMDSQSAVAPAGQGADKLHDLVLRHLGYIQKTPALPAILFSRELHAENDQLRQIFARLMEQRQQIFASLIAQEIKHGNFDASLDPQDAAYLIVALIQGLAMRWSLAERSFDLVTEGGRLMDLQLAGFRKRD